MPEVRGFVVRERLLARLDAVLQHRLTTVVADAGFGKSTLLAQWSSRPCAAHVARPATRDVGGLAGALVQAVRGPRPGAADRLHLVVDRMRTGGPEDSPQALAGLLCAGLAAVPALQFVLVVDDAHLLTPGGGRLLEALVRQAPPTLHVLVTARHQVPFSVERLGGQVLALTGSDLAFDDDELRSVVVDVLGDDELAGAVEGMLGRWPAAVRLAVEALARKAPEDRAAEVVRLHRQGVRDLIALAQEVLAGEPERTRRLAQVVAPYDAFTVEMAEALGCEDAAGTVAALEERGILVRPGPDWVAFPRLLREFLRLRHALPPDEHRVLVRRAGRWLEDNGQAEGALRCALDGPDVDEVARLLREHGRALVQSGRGSRVAQALAVTGAKDPALASVQGAQRESAGDLDGALESYRRAEPDAWVACRTGVLLYQRGDLQGALDVLTGGGATTVDDAHRLAWTATVHWARGEDADAGVVAAQAADLAQRLGDDGALAATHTVLALVAAHRGDRAANREHYEAALAHAERAGDLRQVVRVQNNLGCRLFEQGELAAAREHLGRAVELAEAGGLTFYLALSLANRGELRFHLGQYDEAAADLEAARALDRDGTTSALVALGHVYRHRACAALARQAYEQALEAGRASGDVGLLVPALCGLAQLVVENDHAHAQELVDEALSLDAGLGRVAALLAGASVALARGDRTTALQLAVEAEVEADLRQDRLGTAEALHLAALADPVPYDPRLRTAVALLTDIGAPVWVATVRLSQARRDPEGHAMVAEVAQLATELGARLLADQAAAVARNLDTARSGKGVEITVLGGFRVRRDEVAVERVDWPDPDCRALLERLIARPTWPRAQLARSLWPDADEPEQGLDAALEGLRTVLGDPQHVVDRAGSVRLERVRLDVHEFLAEAEEGLVNRDRALLRRAEARYAGEVLEESPGATWADALREEARARYVEVARALVSLSEPEAAARYSRRILERDPYDEGAHLSLVAALVAQGKEQEARRAWSAYAQRLDELGLEALPWGSDAPAEGVAGPR